MAALSGLGIDNLLIDLNSEEFQSWMVLPKILLKIFKE